jgi:hypothetical protein
VSFSMAMVDPVTAVGGIVNPAPRVSLSQTRHRAQFTDGKEENGPGFSNVQEHSTLRIQSSAEHTWSHRA